MQKLPSELYSVASVVQLEQLVFEQYGISGYTLMRRAGQAVVDLLRQKFTSDKKILILCGTGNNAGDGYVIARLVQQAGYVVSLVSLIDVEQLKGDARQACVHWLECGEVQSFSSELLEQADVVIDALLGTGLARTVSGEWAAVIDALNRADKAVIAVDIPSGLFANTGAIAGVAVRADYTLSFIGLKTGLFTGAGRACAGKIYFHDLKLPADIFNRLQADAHLLNDIHPPLLPARDVDAYKNQFGHVLIVGGNTAMAGAVILAAKAALRSGAGLVTVFTRAEHQLAVNIACPEVMVVGADDASGSRIPDSLLARITHIAIGPGLGMDDWAQLCLRQCLQAGKPLVVDADALNLIAAQPVALTGECVLTPHPGEAARLLNTTSGAIAADRVKAIKKIHQKYASTAEMAVILKGSGSLIYAGKDLAICPWGNPAMATAGMGDVLSGVVVAILAQGLPPGEAAEMAVLDHAMAGDQVAQGKSRGILASDVIAALPQFL